MMFDVQEYVLSVPADKKTLMRVFNLSPMEAGFLQMMLAGDWIGVEEFPDVKYSSRQVIYTLRRKLEKRYGIWIINDGQRKYAIPTTGKRLAKSAIDAFLAGG